MDESYMAAAGRRLHGGYFDHPPAAWWMAWAGAHLGGETSLAIRLPFVLLFELSIALMALLAGRLGGPRAGLAAALALNLSPVFGLSAACWALPDGPQAGALLGFAYGFMRATEGDCEGESRWRWWCAAGACAGLGMFSKYTVVFPLAGAGVYLLTVPSHRAWLRRPQPYVAAALALAVFSPVLAWNVTHHFASFAFQGARAGVGKVRPFAPLVTLAGEALFVAPWFCFALLDQMVRGLRRGPGASRSWLFVCMGVPAIAFFTLASAWSKDRVQCHWPAAGYLLLFPLAAAAAARGKSWALGWPGLKVAAAVMGLLLLVLCSQGLTGWVDAKAPRADGRSAPLDQLLDLTDLGPILQARWPAGGPNGRLVVAANWWMTGKVDYALHGERPVACVGEDRREYGLIQPPLRPGEAVVLVGHPGDTAPSLRKKLAGVLTQLEAAGEAPIRHAGHVAIRLPLFTATVR